MSRSQRRYRLADQSRNDQGENEGDFISRTPAEEAVELGDGASKAPNNSQSDRVKTDDNRSTHTNFEAARRRASRRKVAEHELYKDFLEYAKGQGTDLDAVQDALYDDRESPEYHAFEESMYDFLGVDSVDEDDRLYQLMEAPGHYEINHPNNFRGANRKRRSSRRKVAQYTMTLDNGESYPVDDGSDVVHFAKDRYYGDYDRLDMLDELAEIIDSGGHGWDHQEGLGISLEKNSSRNLRSSLKKRAYDSQHYDLGGRNDSLDAFLGFLESQGVSDQEADSLSPQELELFIGEFFESNPQFEGDFEPIINTFTAAKKISNRRRSAARRKKAEQSDDFDLNTSADIARDVEDEEVFVSETSPETQPKDARMKRRSNRRRHAQGGYGSWGNNETWHANMYLGDSEEAQREIAFSSSPDEAAQIGEMYLEGTGLDLSQVNWDAIHDVYSSDQDYYKNASRNRRRSSRRKQSAWANNETWHANMYLGESEEIAKEISFASSPQEAEDIGRSVLEGSDLDLSRVDWGEIYDVYSSDQDYYKNAGRKRRASHRRHADANLDLAAPNGRVDVEAPVRNTTDDDAQASQFDKKDFGNNAGDSIADPDLSVDQNWAPGDGKKESKASQIEGLRLAEAMIEAKLEKEESRWKLAEAYTKLPATIVRDRTSLLARVASVKPAVVQDNSQRSFKSARRNPGLGKQPALQKTANNINDDSLLFL